jgi:hypothetical protein
MVKINIFFIFIMPRKQTKRAYRKKPSMPKKKRATKKRRVSRRRVRGGAKPINTGYIEVEPVEEPYDDDGEYLQIGPFNNTNNNNN